MVHERPRQRRSAHTMRTAGPTAQSTVEEARGRFANKSGGPPRARPRAAGAEALVLRQDGGVRVAARPELE